VSNRHAGTVHGTIQDSNQWQSGIRAYFYPLRCVYIRAAKSCIIYHSHSGHFTTSENEWNRRNTTKLVFPSLCPNQKVKTLTMVFKYFSSVEFYWHQSIVCWNISHWHSRGTNLQKIEGSGSPLTPIGKLHQSPSSPVLGDRARGKRRGLSTGAARVSTCFFPPVSTHSAGVAGFLENIPGIFEIGRLPLDFSEIWHSWLSDFKKFRFFRFFQQTGQFGCTDYRSAKINLVRFQGKKVEILDDLGKIVPKCPKTKGRCHSHQSHVTRT